MQLWLILKDLFSYYKSNNTPITLISVYFAVAQRVLRESYAEIPAKPRQGPLASYRSSKPTHIVRKQRWQELCVRRCHRTGACSSLSNKGCRRRDEAGRTLQVLRITGSTFLSYKSYFTTTFKPEIKNEKAFSILDAVLFMRACTTSANIVFSPTLHYFLFCFSKKMFYSLPLEPSGKQCFLVFFFSFKRNANTVLNS